MDIKHYEILSQIKLKTEEKNKLKYATWSEVFDELLQKFPDATYKIVKFEGKPYFMDDTGAMVYTEMTVEGITREMCLPVLDGAMMPKKKESYEYTTKYGVKTCEAIDMFDINKTIMRCLVKNIAVFGLGLNIYAGEDLPLGDETTVQTTEKPQETKPSESKDASKPKTMEQLCKVLTYEQYNTLNGNQKLKIQSYISETQKLGSPFCSDEDVKAFLTK